MDGKRFARWKIRKKQNWITRIFLRSEFWKYVQTSGLRGTYKKKKKKKKKKKEKKKRKNTIKSLFNIQYSVQFEMLQKNAMEIFRRWEVR